MRHEPAHWIPFIIAVCLVTIAGSRVDAGVQASPFASPQIIVAKITTVSEAAATNGNPPRVGLEMTQVLRGDPKADYSRAIWNPPWHGIDTSGREGELERWRATPMDKPAVGSRWIIFGRLLEEADGPALSLRYQIAYSPAELAKTVDQIAQVDAATAEYAAKIASEAKALAEARVAWRAKTSSADIGNYVKAADFVAVGTISSGSWGNEPESLHIFQIKQILKGQKRYAYLNDLYFVEVKIPLETGKLLKRDQEYLVFLLDRGFDTRKMPVYSRISLGDGVVIADDAALQAARDTLAAPATSPSP
jgi:hypothetical protein